MTAVWYALGIILLVVLAVVGFLGIFVWIFLFAAARRFVEALDEGLEPHASDAGEVRTTERRSRQRYSGFW
jgi:cytoskeletal protein RodZ